MRVVFTSLVLLYLVFDFGDPSLPGAVSFDPDDCVEAVQCPRAPAPAPPVLAVTPEPLFVLSLVLRSRPRLPRRPSVRVRRARTYLAQHAPPDRCSEDA